MRATRSRDGSAVESETVGLSKALQSFRIFKGKPTNGGKQLGLRLVVLGCTRGRGRRTEPGAEFATPRRTVAVVNARNSNDVLGSRGLEVLQYRLM